MNLILVDFLPIVMLFLLLSYTTSFVEFSHTILGRLFAILIIVFYTYIDPLFGLFVCILVIFYYQTDYVEGMLNNQESVNVNESFESISDAYPLPIFEHTHDESVETINQFKQQYCSKGHLIYKDQNVNIEMIEHIFPEINYEEHKCNVCDKNCNFNIIENIIRTEDELIKPKSSNEYVTSVWENMVSALK